MKAAVITFPGSNCDRDAIEAIKLIKGKVKNVWYKDTNLDNDLDLIILPGGFSYGDYLRSGAMASVAPVIKEVKRLAQKGVYILGICNGFQILTEVGLIKGSLMRNRDMKFICRSVYLKVNNNSKFTENYQKDEVINIPIANMDGNYYASDDILKELEDEDGIAFRYCSKNGLESNEFNPNGSIANIAGVFNKKKNILGMMPHPERAIGHNKDIGGDGIRLFESLLK
jgi:phosphoribosylformylglycinamidine synthase I